MNLSDSDRNIKKHLEKLKEERNGLESEIARIDKEIAVVQGFCSHNDKTRHPRTVAEDESWYTCNVCGRHYDAR